MTAVDTPNRIFFRSSITALILTLLFIGLIPGLAAASTKSGTDTTEKVKAEVAKRSAEKVVVTMKSGSKVKGIVSNILADSFDLVDEKTRQATTIPYREVEKVKKQGWSTGAKVALGVAIGAGVVTAIVLGGLANNSLIGPICPLGCN